MSEGILGLIKVDVNTAKDYAEKRILVIKKERESNNANKEEAVREWLIKRNRLLNIVTFGLVKKREDFSHEEIESHSMKLYGFRYPSYAYALQEDDCWTTINQCNFQLKEWERTQKEECLWIYLDSNACSSIGLK